jgi:exosortase E/protease (VPEID-CTERM system)
VARQGALSSGPLSRLVTALVLLLAEYALVAVHFDGGDLAQRGGWLGRFSAAGELITLSIVVSSAGVLLGFRRLRESWLAVSASLPAVSYGWLLLHGAAFAACYACGAALFARASSDSTGLWLVGFGTLAGLGSVLCLARALFGPKVLELGKALARAAATGALLGLLAWQTGVQARPLWPYLTRATLAVSAFILRGASSAEVKVDAAAATLGLGNFVVEIAPGCSGVEGMGLVAIFMSGYCYRFRRELILSRALLLIPLAIALAWVANALRIAALVIIGAWWSPEIAFGGFHSKAGWVVFCAIALGLVTLLDRSGVFKREAATTNANANANAHAAPPDVVVVVDNPTAGYCIPFLAVLAVALVTGLFTSSFDRLYWLRVLASAAALWWTRSYWTRDFSARLSWFGPAAGVAVFVLWLGFTPHDPAAHTALSQELSRLSPLSRATWLSARLLGTVLMAPLVEELAFRGFLQRWLANRDFQSVPYRQVGWLGILASAAAFGALHPSWLLGTAAGLAYSLASRRRDLADAVTAHATTNLLLAAWALSFGRLDLLT